jgi:hypothetical protein
MQQLKDVLLIVSFLFVLEVSVCEYRNMDFQCINGNRTCRSDTQKWECTCEKGLTPVYRDINRFECEGMLS